MRNNDIYNSINVGAHKHKAANGVVYLTMPNLDGIKGFKHAFTTRIGGVSKPPFDTLNMGARELEDSSIRKKNISLACEAVGLHANNIITINHDHSVNVEIVTKKNAGEGLYRLTAKEDRPISDAFITSDYDLPVMTLHADCIPIYFYDKKQRIISVCHAGWKGVYGNIVSNVIAKLEKEFCTNKEDLLIAVGPCISVVGFEVGDDLAEQFENKYKVYDIITPRINGRHHIDIQKCCCLQIADCDVPIKNMQVANVCTYLDSELFFSYRRDKKCGSMGAFMELNEY